MDMIQATMTHLENEHKENFISCNTLVFRNKAVRAMGVSFQKPHMPASLYGTAV
jgi:hypothetical protein